jgi:drug/metabolite transporter (DMT)-like permease
MFWYVLSLIGAIADAGYYIAIKKFLQTADPVILASGGYTCCGIILFIVSWIRGFPAIGHDFYGALFASSVLGICAVLLSFASLRRTDISLAVPMISFTPLFLMMTAFIILHETPSVMGIAGIVTIVAGSYVLNISSHPKGWSDPFRSIAKNRGVLYMLIVSLLYAVAINFDKIIVTNSDPVVGSSVTCIVLGLSFAGISGFTGLRNRVVPVITPAPGAPSDRYDKTAAIPLKNSIKEWIVLGTLVSVSAVTINTAYTMQIVPYVIALKRMSIIITVLYGGFIAGEEDVTTRLSGALLMVAGAVLIVLFN